MIAAAQAGRADSLARKVALSSGLNIVQQAISVVSGIFVARIVGPDVLGLLAYASAFTGLFTAFSDFGLGTAHIKRLAEGRDLGEGMTVAWLSRGLSLLIMTTVVLGVYWSHPPDSLVSGDGRVVFYLALVTLIVTQLTQVPWTTFTAFRTSLPRTSHRPSCSWPVR